MKRREFITLLGGAGTIRFYSLRLRVAGMIKSSPNKILADGTDWRFWNQLRREPRS